MRYPLRIVLPLRRGLQLPCHAQTHDGSALASHRLELKLTMFNESLLDRMIRVLLGIVLLSLYFIGPRTAWGLLGLIPLATGFVGFCPLYRALGISTSKSTKQS